MAKKKATGAGHRPGKARVELRLDEDVYEGIKKLADGSNMTVNQLINGLVRWARDKGHIGEPERDDEGVLSNRRVAGVVWFGQTGYRLSIEDKHQHSEAFETEAPEFVKGEHYFTLDFTERRVVREDV
jgi:hypothetical protein